MIPKSLVFMMTYKCNFICDHCSVGCSPNNTEVLSWDIIKQAIDQAYAIPSIRLVVFTGGESSLVPDILHQGLIHASGKGFRTRMVSNGWWAKTPEKADECVRKWVEYGLNELNISYDDFHAPYLERYGGEKNVINAIQAASKNGLIPLIGMVLHPKAKITSTYLRRVFAEHGLTEGIQYLEDFMFPLGRARQLPSDMFVLPEDKSNEASCQEAGTTLVVLPSGDVTFCCGHLINTEAQHIITQGNIKSGETLEEMVKRMQRNVFYWWLNKEGPYSIIKEIGFEGDVYRNCEGCHYLATKHYDDLLALAGKKEEIFARIERGSSMGENVSA